MPAYWRTVAGPRTGPRPASRPLRTLWAGHGWTLDRSRGGTLWWHRDTRHTGWWQIGGWWEQRQLSRGVWSAVGRYLRENVNYRDFDRNVSVIARTKNVDTKHFVLLISVYTLNLSHFARHSPRISRQGEQWLSIITQQMSLSSQISGFKVTTCHYF